MMMMGTTVRTKGNNRNAKEGQKLEASHVVGGNVNCCSRVEHSLAVLKKVNIQQPYDPAIPLLRIHPSVLKR